MENDVGSRVHGYSNGSRTGMLAMAAAERMGDYSFPFARVSATWVGEVLKGSGLIYTLIFVDISIN